MAKKKNNSKKIEKKVAPEPQASTRIKQRSTFKLVMPYVLMVFSIVLVISFFIVQIIGSDDGVGVVGYAIQSFFCGLFGPAAFICPVVMFFLGLRWCIYNVKWQSGARLNDDERDQRRFDRRRLRTQLITGTLFLLIASTIIAVIVDGYSDLDIVGMWSDATEDLNGGGVIGGALGLLMITCFEQIISLVILIISFAITATFMVGITPNWIVRKIRDNSVERKEMREREREEELRAAAEAEAERRKSKARAAAENASNVAVDNTRQSQSTDEILEDDDEPRLEPLSKDDFYAAPSTGADKLYIDVNGNIGKIPQPEEQKVEKANHDFGGDPAFDTNEFSGIQSIIDSLGDEKPKPAVKNSISLDEVDAIDDDEMDDIDLTKIENDELISEMASVAPDENEEVVEVITPYVFPSVDMLTKNPSHKEEDYTAELQQNAHKLMETLKSFKVSIKEITYSRGPTITRYELRPEAGTRVRAIANLVDDIALNLATSGVRIEAPIPNKPAVGIEVPNRTRATVYLRDLIDSPKFTEAKSKLTACLGMDVGGNPIYFDISKMPHLLIAGATGMGKSVCINTVIISLLYKAKPDELKLILIDPKKVEFNIYKNIPHLYAPIVSDPKKAAGALASAVAEMERRFEMIEDMGVRDITSYNAAVENDPDREFMPHMVIIIDELADLMMTAPDEVESSICRLAQKARAAGIHLIIGTQRPSVDVITGLIKANIPSRIACTVASQIDSRTILDIAGAEKLIGKGDMLFAPVGSSKPMRVQGAFVSEGEVEKIVTFIRDNNAAGKYNSEFINRLEAEAEKCGNKKGHSGGMDDMSDPSLEEGGDSKFNAAVRLAVEEGKISTSLMQRRLGVGYGRAAKIIDTMEEMGYVSKPDGNKPRRVLLTLEEYERRLVNNEIGSSEE